MHRGAGTNRGTTARWAAALAAAALFSAPAVRSLSQEATPPTANQGEVAAATEFLQGLVNEMRVDVPESQSADDWQVRRAPLFKYSDPARGYLAAGVWRIGAPGRPKGVVSLEYWPRMDDNSPGQPYLSYEFIVVAGRPFELISTKDQLTWRGSGPAVEFRDVPDGPAPAESPRQRLTQMRNILRRFAVKEVYRGDPNALRLLSQPIDRYEDPGEGILDGGAFIFAYGTNPEALILLESTQDQRWRYAVLRMSWAESVVELDGQEVQKFPEVKAHPASGPYQTGGRLVANAP